MKGALQWSAWSAMAFMAAGVVGYAAWMLFLPHLRLDFVDGLFTATPLSTTVHIATGTVTLAAGTLQVNAWIRTRWPVLHRVLGRVYVGAVLLSSVSGLAMAIQSPSGLVAQTGFGAMAVLWFACTAVAYRHIRTGDRSAHRDWMIRSYALTLAAVTLRIYLPASLAVGLPFAEAYPVIAWLCWLPNLLLAEWFIRRRLSAR
jgi:uncharacterized membrane protein